MARLHVELPSKAFLLPDERDARAPSTRCTGNAGVPSAIPTVRKNLPVLEVRMSGRSSQATIPRLGQHPLSKLNSTISRSASSTVPSQLRSSLR